MFFGLRVNAIVGSLLWPTKVAEKIN